MVETLDTLFEYINMATLILIISGFCLAALLRSTLEDAMMCGIAGGAVPTALAVVVFAFDLNRLPELGEFGQSFYLLIAGLAILYVNGIIVNQKWNRRASRVGRQQTSETG